MKLFFSIILFCFSLVSVVSCRSRKPPEPVTIETTKTITEVVKDTVFKVEADSSYYQAWIECVNGKPQIISNAKQAAEYQRKHPESKAAPPISKSGKNLSAPNIKLDQNGKLTADCHQEALNLFKSWKEKYISENQKTTVPVYIEKPFRWYHKALMWLGSIGLIILGFGLVLKFRKPF